MMVTQASLVARDPRDLQESKDLLEQRDQPDPMEQMEGTATQERLDWKDSS